MPFSESLTEKWQSCILSSYAMSPENFLKSQMCLLAWREGHQYGGLANQEAILLLIRNRVRAGWGDYDFVLDQYDSHRPYPADDFSFPDLRDIVFQQLLSKVDYIFDGSAPNKLIGGALYCADLGKPINEKFLSSIVRNPDRERCAQIGPVYFFQ